MNQTITIVKNMTDSNVNKHLKMNYDDSIQFIKESGIGCEVILNCDVMPLYDHDEFKYSNEKEMCENTERDILKNVEKLKKAYGNHIDIYGTVAAGFKSKKKYNCYVNSCHFIIRNDGKLRQTEDTKRVDTFDESIYKKRDKQQLLTLPFCSKPDDRDRKFLPFIIDGNNVKIIRNIDDMKKKDFLMYLPTYCGKESYREMISDEDVISYFDEEYDNEYVDDNFYENLRNELVNEADDDNDEEEKIEVRQKYTYEQIELLTDCLEWKKGYSWDIDYYSKIIWALAKIQVQDGIELEELAYSICKKYTDWKDTKKEQKEFDNKWKEGLKNVDKKMIGMYCLKKVCKEKNEVLYNKWKDNTKERKEIKEYVNFDKNDKYCYIDFVDEYKGKILKKDDLKGFFNDFNRVLAVSEGGKHGHIIKKENCGDGLFSFYDKTVIKHWDFYIVYVNVIKNKEKAEDYNMSKIIQKLSIGYVKLYSTAKCIMDGDEDRVFNVFRPMIATEQKEVDMKLIQPMLNFIKEIICNNNDINYEYLMNWLGYKVNNIGKKSGICVFLFSREQGSGKNTFLNFISNFVLGRHMVVEESGIEVIMKNFNADLENKALIIMNEACASGRDFGKMWQKMKNEIDATFISIEPKGRDKYQIKNALDMAITSNTSESIYLEKTDRRYFCLEVNSKYTKPECKKSFWEPFNKLCMNQEMGDAMLTYLKSDKFRNLSILEQPPRNALKETIIESCLGGFDRFIKNVDMFKNQIELKGGDFDSDDEDDKKDDVEEKCDNEVKMDVRLFEKLKDNRRKGTLTFRTIFMYEIYVDFCKDDKSIVKKHNFYKKLDDLYVKVRIKGLEYYKINEKKG